MISEMSLKLGDEASRWTSRKAGEFLNGTTWGLKTCPGSIGAGRESVWVSVLLVSLRWSSSLVFFYSSSPSRFLFFLFCFPWFLSCSPCLQLFSSLLFFLSFFFSPSSQSSSFFGISILLVFPLFLPFYKPSLLFPSLLLSPFLPFLSPPLSLRILATRENDWWYDSNCKR